MTSTICAVFVTFRPDDSVWANIMAVREQVDRLVVVDNGSAPELQRRMTEFTQARSIELILNRDNRGIAAALNQGAGWAIAQGCEWFATFDQDSRAPAGFIPQLLRAATAYSPDAHVALVAPLYRDQYLGTVWSASGPIHERDPIVKPVTVAATSGNLVSARAFQALGGFREDFFIDLVDFEFCLRARRQGWTVLEHRGVQLEHAQGRARSIRWLWRRPVINDYSAQRRYYQARNRPILYARYAWFNPRWTIRDAVGYASDLTKLLLFCEARRPKLRAIATGYWHALVGRRGRWTIGE